MLAKPDGLACAALKVLDFSWCGLYNYILILWCLAWCQSLASGLVTAQTHDRLQVCTVNWGESPPCPHALLRVAVWCIPKPHPVEVNEVDIVVPFGYSTWYFSSKLRNSLKQLVFQRWPFWLCCITSLLQCSCDLWYLCATLKSWSWHVRLPVSDYSVSHFSTSTETHVVLGDELN